MTSTCCVVLSTRPFSLQCLDNASTSRLSARQLLVPAKFRQTTASRVRAAADGGAVPNSPPIAPASAAEAVNLGLSLFSKGKVKDALAQFDLALAMHPNRQEAQAALYNKACCHAFREEGEKASQALREALRSYDLKFSVILNDPDMAPFRAMPEFRQLQDEARKGGQDIGDSFRRDLKLIGEVQDPYRAVRKFFSVAFVAAAGISTLFTVPRFIQALQGGENSPDLVETVQNLAVNVGGIVAFGALFYWDSKKEEQQMAVIARNETLSRLPLRLQSNRIVEVVQLRGNTRPVIVAGSKEVVDKAMQRAERFREDLVARGVLLIPLVWKSGKEEFATKKGFGGQRKPAVTPVSGLEDFENRAAEVALKGVLQSEKRFKAEIVSYPQWESWIRDQQESEGVTPGEDVYIVLRLDGRIRKSGRGVPDWQGLVDELPLLDAILSKLEK